MSSFKPLIHALSWGEKHRAGRRQQSPLGVFCPDKPLSEHIHFQMWKSLEKKRGKLLPLVRDLEVLGFRYGQGESGLTLVRSFLAGAGG